MRKTVKNWFFWLEIAGWLIVDLGFLEGEKDASDKGK